MTTNLPDRPTDHVAPERPDTPVFSTSALEPDEPAFRTEPPTYRARHEAPGGRAPVTRCSPVPVRCALAHVLRTAVGALAAREDEDVRTGADPSDEGTARRGIHVTSATQVAPLVVRDDGIGLSTAQVRRLLSDPELDAAPTGLSVDDLVQLEAVSGVLRACLRVADVVELRSRSALTDDATTTQAVARRDGSVRVSAAVEPLPSPGTELRLHLDLEHLPHVAAGTTPDLLCDLAEQLVVPVEVDGTVLGLPGPVWDLGPGERDAWCRRRTGAEPLAVIDLGVGPFGTQVVAIVPPYPVVASRARGHRVHVDDVLLPDGRARLLPAWAAFCTLVLDAGLLPLTPEGDALAPGKALDSVGEHVARGLLVQLVLLADLEPERFRAMAQVHGEALLAAAREHPDVLDLVRGVVPVPTSLGEMTLDELSRVGGVVPVAGADTWFAVRDVAERRRLVVVDGRRDGVARLVEHLGEDGPAFAALHAEHLPALGLAPDGA